MSFFRLALGRLHFDLRSLGEGGLLLQVLPKPCWLAQPAR